MKHWLGPSLLRRIVLTLLATLLLVWALLSLKDYWAFKRDMQGSESLGRMAQTLLDSLEGLSAAQAQAAMTVTDRQFNALRHQTQPHATGDLLFSLHQADATLVYRSEVAPTLPALPAHADLQVVDYQGVRYWPVVRHNAHWRLAVWVPVLPDSTALTLIGTDILSYIVLALPLVVLTMALAVWLGLRPLRRLAQQVAARPDGDLSALQEPTGYAEIAPLVEASNALLARARHQQATQQAFVQDAAHELKTPLAVVSAQAHVLATASSTAERSAALQALENGVQRASHQVNQLLTLAALDHPPQHPPQAMDLVEMAREVLIELAPLAHSRAVTLALQSPETLEVVLPEQALRLVLMNLVPNAIVHGAQGGNVELQIALLDGTLQIKVSDDGPGIAAHERHRVFDRFYRGASAHASGSGLGLAIVARVAQQLNAHVWIGDGPNGQGITVVFSLNSM